MMLLAMVITLGISFWSFANSSIDASIATYTTTMSDYINYLSERFVIVNVLARYDAISDLNTNTCNRTDACISIWVYNNGQLIVTPKTIILTHNNNILTIDRMHGCSIEECRRIINLNDNFSIKPKDIGIITLNLREQLRSGIYELKIISQYGNIQTYTFRV